MLTLSGRVWFCRLSVKTSSVETSLDVYKNGMKWMCDTQYNINKLLEVSLIAIIDDRWWYSKWPFKRDAPLPGHCYYNSSRCVCVWIPVSWTCRTQTGLFGKLLKSPIHILSSFPFFAFPPSALSSPCPSLPASLSCSLPCSHVFYTVCLSSSVFLSQSLGAT